MARVPKAAADRGARSRRNDARSRKRGDAGVRGLLLAATPDPDDDGLRVGGRRRVDRGRLGRGRSASASGDGPPRRTSRTSDCVPLVHREEDARGTRRSRRASRAAFPRTPAAPPSASPSRTSVPGSSTARYATPTTPIVPTSPMRSPSTVAHPQRHDREVHHGAEPEAHQAPHRSRSVRRAVVVPHLDRADALRGLQDHAVDVAGTVRCWRRRCAPPARSRSESSTGRSRAACRGSRR